MIIRQHVPVALINGRSWRATDCITVMLADAEEDLGDNVRSTMVESVNEVLRDVAIYHNSQILQSGSWLDSDIRHTFQRLVGISW